jgi:predicted dienelactone hydrolase
MKILLSFALLGLVALTPLRAVAYEPPAATQSVEIVRYEWHDDVRDRDVPVKIYFPKDGSNPRPIIIFSHGLGGSREGYEYLGRHWAGCGYVSVHLQHLGSDERVWKNAAGPERMQALRRATLELANTVNRPKDVSFAIDRLLALNSEAESPLKGRLDTKSIGMAGHSYGGFTTMAIAGQEFGPAKWADSRVKAAIQMSAPVARPAQRAHAYTGIVIPVFHMTGTRDDSPIGDTKAAERRIPFDHMNAVETCLLTFADGDHMVFAGAPRLQDGAREQDAKFQKLICGGSTAFWDAWLKGDTAAHAWLMDGGFEKLLGATGVFEKKTPAK